MVECCALQVGSYEVKFAIEFLLESHFYHYMEDLFALDGYTYLIHMTMEAF